MTDDSWAVASSVGKVENYVYRLTVAPSVGKKKASPRGCEKPVYGGAIYRQKKKKKWQAHVCEENRFCEWKTGFVSRKPVL